MGDRRKGRAQFLRGGNVIIPSVLVGSTPTSHARKWYKNAETRRVVKRVATLGRGVTVARLILVQQIAVRVRSSQPSCKVRTRPSGDGRL